jgi:hypothetical protein
VWAVTNLCPYLEGKSFTVRTDKHALRWVMNLADTQGRLLGGAFAWRNSTSMSNIARRQLITPLTPYPGFPINLRSAKRST